MSKSKEKLLALQLRRRGESIKDIAKKLNVSRGSVSLWCQEILLTSTQKQKLKKKQIAAGHAGRMQGAEMNKKKRLDAISRFVNDGMNEIGSLSERDLLMLGIGLYWGEGIKSRTGQTAMVNSDPNVLKVAKKWFQVCLGVLSHEFRPYIYIAPQHKPRETIIVDYWSKELSIPKSQFKSPIYIPQKPRQKYENHDTYYGVVALRVTKSTNLKYRIQGLISASAKALE
jgi:Homeodomain-like domain